jgi:Domain of unknown function (DUF4114)
MATNIIQTATGDGELKVTVDEFGRFGSASIGGNAFYDPLGSLTSSGTTYRSYVALGLIGSGGTTGTRSELRPVLDTSESFISATTDNTTSSFISNGLQFNLKQTSQSTFNASGTRAGSRLDQVYTITNPTNQVIDFDLIRYVDGDLFFDGTLVDGGGRIVQSGQDILFETDQGGTGQTDLTFFGITSNGGTTPTTNRFELDFYSTLSNNVLAGSTLRDRIIQGDANSDQFIDASAEYDVALGLRNVFSLAPGASTTYTATTRFGSGEPLQLDITPPTGGVSSLAATTVGQDITVSWNATDPGGIRSYDVFVSINGAGYIPWQTSVTTTSAVYAGTLGSTYAFYALATDNGGNQQPVAGAPIATTRLVETTPPIDPPTTPAITLAVAPNNVSENGTDKLVYTFTRPASSTSALTVNYTVGGTAASDADYTQSGAASFTTTTGTITFAAGATTATLTISPTADNIVEPNETVALTLVGGTGYTIGTSEAITGTILETVVTPPTGGALQQIGTSGLLQLGSAGALRFSKTSHEAAYRNELGVFVVDDNNGTVNGITAGQSGYFSEVLKRSQVVFSSLSNSSVDLALDGLSTRTVNLAANSKLGFYLVADGTVDESPSNVLFSFPTTNNGFQNAQVTTQSNGSIQLAWEDVNGGGDRDFNDLVVQIENAPTPTPVGITQQGRREILDLTTTAETVTANFVVNRDAGYDNHVGFYKIEDADGAIRVGSTLIRSDEAGYRQAIFQNRITDLDLTGTNNQAINSSGTFQGGALYAPFLIANSATGDADFSNVYTAYRLGNADNTDHIRLLADNTFGFEDLLRGGDRDFNDLIVKITF